MITVHHHPRHAPAPQPRVLAVFSFRHDAHLVPDLLHNITPLVDGWIAYDDRDSTEFYTNEPARRQALLVTARAEGADWILAVDPDERFEAGLAPAMPELTAATGPVAYSFPLRELHGLTHYRIDGVWGQKRQTRLFRLPPRCATPATALHFQWDSLIPQVDIRHTGFNLYHLKMISPARRQARAALYEHLDPEHRIQPIGYQYLADGTGAEFETIPPGREYQPPHKEDDGLWMPVAPGLPRAPGQEPPR